MINVEQLAKNLKLDESKVYEALPAMCTIIEKAELVDYATALGTMTNATGYKLMIRLISRMKDYEQELEEVLDLLFNVDIKNASNKEKMELLMKLLTEKEVSDFF